MKYIADFKEGDRISGVYLVKSKASALTKAGKTYENVVLQDKTGTIDTKIWDPTSPGISDYDPGQFVSVMGDVSNYNGNLQFKLNKLMIAAEDEYVISDYIPTTERDMDEMYGEILKYVSNTKNQYLKKLLEAFFLDKEFEKNFKNHSAAKTVHHGFVGGLLEHTLSVTNLCDYFAKQYSILNHDLVVAAAMLHDIGKVKELTEFPYNDYSDEGNLLGHITMGMEMVGEKIKQIDGFPKGLEVEIKHCILAHHGELEFGSPKKPAIPEAMALNFADNLDAKMETFKEALKGTPEGNTEWAGFNKFIDSNIRRSGNYE